MRDSVLFRREWSWSEGDGVSEVASRSRPDAPEVPAWTYREVAVLEEFPRTGWGRRGYDEVAVDAFMAQVSRDLTAADEEITDLRGEVDRLHQYIRRQWAAVAAAERAAARATGAPLPEPGEAGPSTPAAQARAVLTQAQELADRRLAQADQRLAEAEREAAERVALAEQVARRRIAEADEEASRRIGRAEAAAAQRLSAGERLAEEALGNARQESDHRRAQSRDDVRRLLHQARTRYADIVTRAHRRADRAAEAALGEFGERPGDDAARARIELEMKAAYLRTFAKVSRAALTVALDVTAREFDGLLRSSSLEEELAKGLDPATPRPPDLAALPAPGRPPLLALVPSPS
jgi:DivIVA domain-containing protein